MLTMRILNLKLDNYRNCQNLELDFSSNKILIIGKNAQGKTNILESVYFLSHLKSPRTSNIKELLNFNAEKFEINANITKADTNIDMNLSFENSKKVLKLNSLKTTPKNFKSTIKTVLFSTEDLLLLRGTPQDRRTWLDRAISQIYPAYDERLSKYEKIRIQKNNLLKQPEINMDLLDVYNQQLVITGSNIILLRQKFLKELKNHAIIKHNNIAEFENFDLKYSIDISNIEEIANYLESQLSERKAEELARKQACVGPHRDDVLFFINNNDATKFASQGQQRTIVLSLKLAEINLIKEKIGESPILLLDDVLAELDDIRQNYLLKTIENDTQTIITSVDTLLFDNNFLKDVTVYNIKNGNIIQ